MAVAQRPCRRRPASVPGMDRPDWCWCGRRGGVEEWIVLDAGQAEEFVSMPFTSSIENDGLGGGEGFASVLAPVPFECHWTSAPSHAPAALHVRSNLHVRRNARIMGASRAFFPNHGRRACRPASARSPSPRRSRNLALRSSLLQCLLREPPTVAGSPRAAASPGRSGWSTS